MLQTAVITIGRNMPETNLPMSEKDWADFRSDLRTNVQSYATQTLFSGTGQGVYEGHAEESFALIVLAPKEHLPALRTALRHLAGLYGQEAIGFVSAAADSTLLYATPQVR